MIENSLFQGDVKGVVATNALELGVDIGSLDAVLHMGCPFSIGSFFQQAGRAGRREQDSVRNPLFFVSWGFFVRFVLF
jgi:DEAD/DEAH box helicase domain-containing protein